MIPIWSLLLILLILAVALFIFFWYQWNQTQQKSSPYKDLKPTGKINPTTTTSQSTTNPSANQSTTNPSANQSTTNPSPKQSTSYQIVPTKLVQELNDTVTTIRRYPDLELSSLQPSEQYRPGPATVTNNEMTCLLKCHQGYPDYNWYQYHQTGLCQLGQINLQSETVSLKSSPAVHSAFLHR